MPRPLSGSMSRSNALDGTPSGGPDPARELMSSAARRMLSAFAPSHFATRAYMLGLLGWVVGTLAVADAPGEPLELRVVAHEQGCVPRLLRDHPQPRRDPRGDLRIALRGRVVVPHVQLAAAVERLTRGQDELRLVRLVVRVVGAEEAVHVP